MARLARPVASSEWKFQGLGTLERPEDVNLREFFWKPREGRRMPLAKSPCQWLQLDGLRLNRLGVELFNGTNTWAEVTVTLRKVESVWDYSVSTAEPLWSGTLQLSPNGSSWVWAETELENFVPGCHRLELQGPEGVEWNCSGNRCHGVVGGHIIGSGRYHWNRLYGEFAFQCEPAQRVFSASQVVSGVTRPADGTHLWLSDPSASMPQWVELCWPEPVEIRQVELTFPSQLVLETHWENPFYVAPHTAKEYAICVYGRQGNWVPLVNVTHNTATRRQHVFGEVTKTDRLRVVIHSTHLSRSAGLAEIRCY